MNDPKTYTATDIERYHNGQLKAAERHALEKAALADPFLADALEGYALTQTPSEDLSTLQQKLQLRIEKEKKNRGVFYLNNWLKVAALIVLVAGAGWAVLRLFTNSEPVMALKGPTVNQAPAANSETVVDSGFVSPASPITAQTTVPQKENETLHSKAIQDNTIARKAPLQKNNNVPAGALVVKIPDSLATKDVASNSKAEAMQGRVSGVTVNNAQDNAVAMNEERKELALKKAAPATFYKNNGYSAPAKDTIRNFNVTMRRTELPASETVVLNTKPKEKTRERKMNISIDSTEPDEGWVRFDDYIAQNLKEPDELKTKGVHGEVELTFEVNKEGEAVNIAVTKSLCDKCDEEAVRLLKQGPKWKKNKKGKVKIKFPITQ